MISCHFSGCLLSLALVPRSDESILLSSDAHSFTHFRKKTGTKCGEDVIEG